MIWGCRIRHIIIVFTPCFNISWVGLLVFVLFGEILKKFFNHLLNFFFILCVSKRWLVLLYLVAAM